MTKKKLELNAPDRIFVDSTHWYKARSHLINRVEYVRADIFIRETERLKKPSPQEREPDESVYDYLYRISVALNLDPEKLLRKPEEMPKLKVIKP